MDACRLSVGVEGIRWKLDVIAGFENEVDAKLAAGLGEAKEGVAAVAALLALAFMPRAAGAAAGPPAAEAAGAGQEDQSSVPAAVSDRTGAEWRP